jgi:GT2 family glycosyltransferase
MNPKVKVLILSYNGKHLLEESVSSYLSNDYPNFEVIVIDNGSTDGTKEWVEHNYPEVVVLRTEKNLGYSGGFNFGLNYAFIKSQAAYVLITNNDVKADSKVISELVKVAETDMMIGFVTGIVYYFDNPSTIQSAGYEQVDLKRYFYGHRGNKLKDIGAFDHIQELDFSDDIFMLVRRNLYISMGGYSDLIKFQGEQFEWQLRAKSKGFKVYFTPHSKIWHKESMTIGKNSVFKQFNNTKNTYLIRLLHKDREFILSFSLWYFFNGFFIPIIKNLVKFRIDMAIAILKGYLSALYYGIKVRILKYDRKN